MRRIILLIAISALALTEFSLAEGEVDKATERQVILVIPNGATWNSDADPTWRQNAVVGLVEAIKRAKDKPSTLRLSRGLFYRYHLGEDGSPKNKEGAAFILSGDVLLDGGYTPKGLVLANGSEAGHSIISGRMSLLPKHTWKDGRRFWTVLEIAEGADCFIRNVQISEGQAINQQTLRVDFNSGGGVYIHPKAKLSMVNVLITANYAREKGGGIYNAGSLAAVNCTIAGNSSSKDGGGVFTAMGGNPPAATSFQNCIVAMNASQVKEKAMTPPIPSTGPSNGDVNVLTEGQANCCLFGALPDGIKFNAKKNLCLVLSGEHPVPGFLKSPTLATSTLAPVIGDLRLVRSSVARGRGQVKDGFSKEISESLVKDIRRIDRKKPPGVRIDLGAFEYSESRRRSMLIRPKSDALVEWQIVLHATDLRDDKASWSEGELSEAFDLVEKYNGPDSDQEDDDIERIWLLSSTSRTQPYRVKSELSLIPFLQIAGGFKNIQEVKAALDDPKSFDSRSGKETILDGGGKTRIFSGKNCLDVALHKLLLVSGNANGEDGGAIHLFQSGGLLESDISCDHLAVSGCKANNGGAIWTNGAMTFSHCTIAYNEAINAGAGLSINDRAKVELKKSVVIKNSKNVNTGSETEINVSGEIDESSQSNFIYADKQNLKRLKHGENGNLLIDGRFSRGQVAILDNPGRWMHVSPGSSFYDLTPTRIAPFRDLGDSNHNDLRGEERSDGHADLGAYEYICSRPDTWTIHNDIIDLQATVDLAWSYNGDDKPENDVQTIEVDSATSQFSVQRSFDREPIQLDVSTEFKPIPLPPFIEIRSKKGHRTIVEMDYQAKLPQETYDVVEDKAGVPVYQIQTDSAGDGKNDKIEVRGQAIRFIARNVGNIEISGLVLKNGKLKQACIGVISEPGWVVDVAFKTCEFSGWNAGAIIARGAVQQVGLLHLDNCEFINNSSLNKSLGGAIRAFNVPVHLLRVFFKGNKSPNGHGGAVGVQETSLNVAQCTFTENSAGDGGAIWGGGSNATMSLTSSTIVYNNVRRPKGETTSGGGIWFGGSLEKLVINECIVAQNSNQAWGNVPTDLFINAVYDEKNIRFGKAPNVRESNRIDSWLWSKQQKPLDFADQRGFQQERTEAAMLSPDAYFGSETREILPLYQWYSLYGNWGASAGPKIIPYVTGSVVNKKGKALAGIKVTLIEPSWNEKTTVTNTFGRFVFRNIPFSNEGIQFKVGSNITIGDMKKYGEKYHIGITYTEGPSQ